jgi:hypothetical protein
MAVPQLSKMVTDCQRQYAFVARFVQTHRQTLLDAFGKVFRPLEAGETAPDVTVLVDGPLRRLRETLDDLFGAERRHLDEIADHGVYRAERDQVALELYRLLFDLRNLFRANFGKKKTEEAGFARRLRPEPLAMLLQVDRILTRLHDGGFELPPARFARATRKKAIKVLEPAARQLRRAVDLAAHQECKAQVTRAAKLKAMKRFGNAYRANVDLFKAVCRFAGRRDLTRRLRRPARRSEKPGSAPS